LNVTERCFSKNNQEQLLIHLETLICIVFLNVNYFICFLFFSFVIFNIFKNNENESGFSATFLTRDTVDVAENHSRWNPKTATCHAYLNKEVPKICVFDVVSQYCKQRSFIVDESHSPLTAVQIDTYDKSKREIEYFVGKTSDGGLFVFILII
jgi:hypothetical protein